MKIKLIKTDAELNNFSKQYVNSFLTKKVKQKDPIPLEEIKNYTFVYGLYNNNELIGGYVLNLTPYRILIDMPFRVKEQIKKDFLEHKTIELCTMWKKDKKTPITMMWIHMVIKSILQKPKYIYFSVYGHHGMHKQYKETNAEIVYHAEKTSICLFRADAFGMSKKILMREISRNISKIKRRLF